MLGQEETGCSISRGHAHAGSSCWSNSPHRGRLISGLKEEYADGNVSDKVLAVAGTVA
jgi:hypothetical protein